MGSEAAWSHETPLGSRVPPQACAAAAATGRPCPREGRAHGKAVPTVLRADVVAGLAGTFTGGWVVGGEYNQLEMRLH